MTVTILTGDCRELLPGLQADVIDPVKAANLRARPMAAWAPRPTAEVRKSRTDLERYYGVADEWDVLLEESS